MWRIIKTIYNTQNRFCFVATKPKIRNMASAKTKLASGVGPAAGICYLGTLYTSRHPRATSNRLLPLPRPPYSSYTGNNRRLINYWMILQDYDFRFVYRKGETMKDADWLSRAPLPPLPLERDVYCGEDVLAADRDPKSRASNESPPFLFPTPRVITPAYFPG